jgi:creatinine amidohydrolase/Fe(II)-dependent formamide hydrolase-like protein
LIESYDFGHIVVVSSVSRPAVNKDITDTGGFGPPIDEVNYVAESTAQLGERMITKAVDFMVEFIEEFRKVPILRPNNFIDQPRADLSVTMTCAYSGG